MVWERNRRAVRHQFIGIPQRRNWSHALKEVAMTLGADDFGIAAMRKDWVFEGHQVKG